MYVNLKMITVNTVATCVSLLVNLLRGFYAERFTLSCYSSYIYLVVILCNAICSKFRSLPSFIVVQHMARDFYLSCSLYATLAAAVADP